MVSRCARLTLLLGLTSACIAPVETVDHVDSPAGPGAVAPNLATGGNGTVYLSWLEPDGDAHVLRFSAWEGTGWAEPRTIARGSDWFVNWADVPSMAALADGTLAAHWLAKSAEETYAYDVLLAVSRDGGRTWSEPVRPHDDGTPTEHGFASLVPAGERFLVVWLDGRAMAEEGGSMSVRSAFLDAEGNVSSAAIIDDRVCECCSTDAARAGDGTFLAVFRDRSGTEIRDIGASRFDGSSWSAVRAVHDDGWEIKGCPVNGPALAARGDDVACSWFTAAGDEGARAYVAFSNDGGLSFADPIRIHERETHGRVDLVLLDDGSALVSSIEKSGEDAAIVVRRIRTDGTVDLPAATIPTSSARASGFPRLARTDGATVLAWTEPGDPSKIRTASLRLPD